jgi:hypothetical protein
MDEATGQGKSRPSETAYPRRQMRHAIVMALARRTMSRQAPGGPARSSDTTTTRIPCKQKQTEESISKQKQFHLLSFIFRNRDVSKGYG